MDDSYWHWGTKPIRAIGRVAYVAAVTTVVAPVGSLWFGSKTVKHLSLYAVAKYQGNESGKREEWERCTRHRPRGRLEVPRQTNTASNAR